MIPPKKFRFGERMEQANQAGQMVLTAEDEQNLDAYVGKIRETVDILRKEIAGIKEGNLEVVSEVFEEKSKILKWLELRTPVVEPFFHHDFAQKLNIKGHLAELKNKIEEDGALLSRMAVAARTVLREVEKINNRNNLGGVYGKSGQKVSGEKAQRVNVDREL